MATDLLSQMLVPFSDKRVANVSKQHKLCCPLPPKKKKMIKRNKINVLCRRTNTHWNNTIQLIAKHICYYSYGQGHCLDHPFTAFMSPQNSSFLELCSIRKFPSLFPSITPQPLLIYFVSCAPNTSRKENDSCVQAMFIYMNVKLSLYT